MSDKKNAWGLLAALNGECDGDASMMADRFLSDLKVNARQRSVLFPLIVWAASHEAREQTRQKERSVFGGGSKRRSLGVVIDSVELRKRLLDEWFALGDGRRVRMGDALDSEHEARIAMLERHVAGVRETIAVHVDAIARIRAAGVSCLNDLLAGEVAA